MAEDLVVMRDLTDTMIETGARLVEQLDQSGWPVVAAFWYFFSDPDQWRLVIASPRVAETGPREAYKHIQETRDRVPDDLPLVRLHDVQVTEPSHPLVRLLGTSIGTGPGISRIRFRDNVINGTFVDDALIYRLNPNARAA